MKLPGKQIKKIVHKTIWHSVRREVHERITTSIYLDCYPTSVRPVIDFIVRSPCVESLNK